MMGLFVRCSWACGERHGLPQLRTSVFETTSTKVSCAGKTTYLHDGEDALVWDTWNPRGLNSAASPSPAGGGLCCIARLSRVG